MNNNSTISSIQHQLDEKGIFTHINTVRPDKHDLIINYEVKATSDNKAFLERILRNLLRSLPPQ